MKAPTNHETASDTRNPRSSLLISLKIRRRDLCAANHAFNNNYPKIEYSEDKFVQDTDTMIDYRIGSLIWPGRSYQSLSRDFLYVIHEGCRST